MHIQLTAEVIEHVEGMPYSSKYREFQAHLKDCEHCAEAHAAELDCHDYCPEGHRLIHLISMRMAQTASASQWN